jgi:nucleoside-diphosphate-sugar epimerase
VPFVDDDVYAQVLVQLHLPLCMAQAVLRNAKDNHAAPSLVLAGSHWQRVEGQEGCALNVYAAHKTALEQSLKPLAQYDGLGVCALRLGDVYGPHDPRGKLLSLLSAASQNGETLALSPGEQRLDWVHVHDVALAFVHALQTCAAPLYPQTFATYGVGTGLTHSLRDVVALWNTLAPQPCAVQWGGRPYREREVMLTHVGTLLPGWHAAIGLERGMRLILAEHTLGS